MSTKLLGRFLPRIRLCIKIFITCDEVLVASRGLIEALEAVKKAGSIRGAARLLGINYKRLWSRIARAEKLLGLKLIEVTPSGSRLTREAEELIEKYKELERSIGEACVDTSIECSA